MSEVEDRLRAALVEARRVLVLACGETAPFIRVALKHIDEALAFEGKPQAIIDGLNMR